MKKLLLLLLVAPVLAALFNPLSSAAKINQPRSVTEKTWGTPFKVENGRYYYRINNWVLIEQYNESGIAIATAYYKEGVDFTAAEVADLDKNNPVPTSPLIKLGKNPAWISAWATKDGSFVKQVLVSDKGVRVYSRGYCTAQGVARLSKPAPTPAAPVITERPRPVFQPPPAVSIPRLVAWAKPAIVEIFATPPTVADVRVPDSLLIDPVCLSPTIML